LPHLFFQVGPCVFSGWFWPQVEKTKKATWKNEKNNLKKGKNNLKKRNEQLEKTKKTTWKKV